MVLLRGRKVGRYMRGHTICSNRYQKGPIFDELNFSYNFSSMKAFWFTLSSSQILNVFFAKKIVLHEAAEFFFEKIFGGAGQKYNIVRSKKLIRIKF